MDVKLLRRVVGCEKMVTVVYQLRVDYTGTVILERPRKNKFIRSIIYVRNTSKQKQNQYEASCINQSCHCQFCFYSVTNYSMDDSRDGVTINVGPDYWLCA